MMQESVVQACTSRFQHRLLRITERREGEGKEEEIRGQERWLILRRPVDYGGQVAYGWMVGKGKDEDWD